jgi:hypothetical protein
MDKSRGDGLQWPGSFGRFNPDGCPNAYCVFDGFDPSQRPKCPDATGVTCVDDYLAFPERLCKEVQCRSLSKKNLEVRISEHRTTFPSGRPEPATSRGPGELLGTALRRELNLDFLLEGFEQRPLQAITISRFSGSCFDGSEILLRDEYVGELYGIYLVPKNTRRFPAVIGFHGHAQNPCSFLKFCGYQYPENGLAIFVPLLKVLGGLPHENAITRALLMAGCFKSPQVHVYEANLAAKFLRSRPNVTDVGFRGHSEGATIGNIAAWTTDLISAFVTDAVADYSGLAEDGHSLLSRAAPNLWVFRREINDFSNRWGGGTLDC